MMEMMMMKIMMRDMLRKAVVQAGSSDIEEAAAVTEDIPSNEEAMRSEYNGKWLKNGGK